MFIAVDGWSKEMPNDVRELEASSWSAPAVTNLGILESAEIDKLTEDHDITEWQERRSASALDRWDVQSHQYKTRVDIEGSVLARLFSGSAEVSDFGLVQEAKRFCILSTSKNRRVEYGTAVRLSVVIIGKKLDVALTLPNIAATAQISNLQARISLSVDGYVGPLGNLLPAPANLNVENLEVYTSAFKSIQEIVFGPEGSTFIAPTLLGYDAGEA